MTFKTRFTCLLLLFALSFVDVTFQLSVEDEAQISRGGFQEKRLAKRLLRDQKTGANLGRPVDSFSEPVQVEFGINLQSILRINEDAGQLITNIWTHFKWHDLSLRWNKSVLGVDIVRLPAHEIWTPDVSLFNYADTRPQQHRNTLAVVYPSGTIDWIPTGIFKSTCSIDTFSFPFDEQVCDLVFSSLSHGTDLLNLTFVDGRKSMSLDAYVENPEWEIIENVASRNIGYRGMKTPYYDLTFVLRLKRRSVFHRYVLLLPCVLLSLTAGVLFLLPPESPAKIQIGIFIFQGFFLLLNLLKNSTPPSGSNNPIICSYYSSTMIATTVVMFACGFLVEVHFRADRKAPMSDRMRNVVIRILAQWLFIPIPSKSPLEIKRQRRLKSLALATSRRNAMLRKQRAPGSPALGARCAVPLLANGSSMSPRQPFTGRAARKQSVFVHSDFRRRLSSWGKSLFQDKNSKLVEFYENEDPEKPDGILGDLLELRKTFQRVAEKQATREYLELVRREWLIAIMVFDRIFFFLYIGYIIVSLYMLLPQDE